jgi:hypothetical protein
MAADYNLKGMREKTAASATSLPQRKALCKGWKRGSSQILSAAMEEFMALI